MKFHDSAPFGRECYWMLSIYECEHEMVHRWIMYVSLVAHLIPIAFGTYLLWYRRKYLWPTLLSDSESDKIVRLPVDAMVGCFLGACVTRWLQTILVLTDALPTFAARELFNDFSYWFGLWAVTVFLTGIIEAIPPVFVRGIGNSSLDHESNVYGPQLTVWVPPRWLFVSLFIILMLWGACLTAPFMYTGGYGADIEDWELFDWGLRWGYSMWSANLIILGIIACYYCVSLLVIIRSNLKLQKGAKNHEEEMASVYHLQRTFLYNWLVCVGGTSICVTWGFFHTQVLQHFWFSLLMEIPIHILWWPVIVLIIMQRIYSNSVCKAETILRHATQQNSINTSSKITQRASAAITIPAFNGKSSANSGAIAENGIAHGYVGRPRTVITDWRVSQHGDTLAVPTTIAVDRVSTHEDPLEDSANTTLSLKLDQDVQDDHTPAKTTTSSPRDTMSSLRSNSLAGAVEKLTETAGNTLISTRYSRVDTPIPTNSTTFLVQNDVLAHEEHTILEEAVDHSINQHNQSAGDITINSDTISDANRTTTSTTSNNNNNNNNVPARRARDTLRLSINSDHLLMAHYGGLVSSPESEIEMDDTRIPNYR
ncbi:hypothetical protein BDF22DRAFT_746365 [Syncephalis plumigaleata]|nr:hypothetical protein BDF22DRAFT_746365 [Syncephalis plumigaleata]